MSVVSVIMCCYNDGTYVGRALESLYHQTLPRTQYEVMLVNDGSTDETEAVAARYRRQRNFCYIKHITKLGLAHSCNHGLQEAKGDYVIRLDADDTFEPVILEAMSRPLMTESTDFVYCDRYEWLEDRSERRYVSLADFNLFRLIAIGTMMRRALMLKIGGYHDIFWEEYDFYIRYLLSSDKAPYYIPKALLTYTVRGRSMTADLTTSQSGWEELKRLWPLATLQRFGHLPDTVPNPQQAQR